MTEPDYRALQFWLLVAQFGVNVIAWVAGFLSLRRKATADEIKGISGRVQTLETSQGKTCNEHLARTIALEAQAKTAPTHADLGAVYDRINMVKGAVDEMVGAVKGLSTQVQLLVKYHMGEGK